MRALVLGGTGFLGLNLVHALQRAGHELRASRRPSSNTIFLRRLKAPMVTARLEEPASLSAAMSGAEVVFFCAGHYPRLSFDLEAQVRWAVAGLDHVLAAAKTAGVRRVVYVGSVATVARPDDDRPAREEDGQLEDPGGSTYLAVKLALEQRALAAARDGQDVVLALPTGCLGPWDHKVGTGFFVLGVASGALEAWVDGRVNMVDAGDVASSLIAAAERGVAGERYILGGHNLTVRALLELLADRAGTTLAVEPLDPAAAITLASDEEVRAKNGGGRPRLTLEMVELAVGGQYVENTKAREALGLCPRPLEDTLDRALGWYRQSGYLKQAKETPA